MEEGTTLVEIIVVILMITLFSAILIADFPRILRQFALSRATYKLAQDLRKTEDLGLSGVSIKNREGDELPTKGYGVYFNIDESTKYVIYADVNASQTFDNPVNAKNCDEYKPGDEDDGDCIIETVDISENNPELRIKSLKGINSSFTSINFIPPNPDIRISQLCDGCKEAGIVIGLSSDSLTSKTVWVNSSGLIEVK